MKPILSERVNNARYRVTADGGIILRDSKSGKPVSEWWVTSIEAEVAPTIVVCQRTRIIDPPLRL